MKRRSIISIALCLADKFTRRTTSQTFVKVLKRLICTDEVVFVIFWTIVTFAKRTQATNTSKGTELVRRTVVEAINSCYSAINQTTCFLTTTSTTVILFRETMFLAMKGRFIVS